MTDKNAYTISAASQGGFLVFVAYSPDRDGYGVGEFASTTLDEALRYIRKRLIPEGEINVDPDIEERLRQYMTINPLSRGA